MADEKSHTMDIAAMEAILVEKFRCPTCYQYIICGPIKQCMAGHVYCSSCFRILAQCWLCAAPMADIRCTTLEILHSILNFPCKGNRKGCTFSGKAAEIKDHERSCQYTAISCPAGSPGCSWTGNLCDVIPHLTKDHPENLSVTSQQEMTCNRDMEPNKMQTHIFSANGNVFRFHWFKDVSGTLRFGLFKISGAPGEPYCSYRITVTHATRPGGSMTYSEQVRVLVDGGRDVEWSDLWIHLCSTCWMEYCDDEGNLHYTVFIDEFQ